MLFFCLADPEWASYTLGTFVCQSCSGLHRNIAHISKVKSILLDPWSSSEVEVSTRVLNGFFVGGFFFCLQKTANTDKLSITVMSVCRWEEGWGVVKRSSGSCSPSLPRLPCIPAFWRIRRVIRLNSAQPERHEPAAGGHNRRLCVSVCVCVCEAVCAEPRDSLA